MKIKWFGHSCFLITSAHGVRILTDPFDDTVGYEVPQIAADIVSTSHQHFDHNNTEIVEGKFFLVNKTGTFSNKNIKMKGIAAFHDEHNGRERGRNIIYNFIVDGIRVCHCGDLGHMLTHEQAAEIGPVDVLLLPVGGVATIGAEQAKQVAGLLKPELIIPMHFQTEVLTFPLEQVERFIGKMGKSKCIYTGKQEIELQPGKFSASSPKVMVLAYGS